MTQSAKWLLKAAVSGAILAVILANVDFNAFVASISGASPSLLLLAFGVLFMENASIALAWREMLSAEGIRPPLLHTIRIQLIANFVGFAMPSSLGVDAVRGMGMASYIKDIGRALSSLIILRITGYAFLFLMASAAIWMYPNLLPDTPAMNIIGLAITAGAAGSVLCFAMSRLVLRLAKAVTSAFGAEWIYEKIEKNYSLFFSFLRSPRAMAAAFGGAMMTQVMRVTYIYVISSALGYDVQYAVFLVFVPVIAVILMAPVSISGIGVREGGYVMLFKYAGLTTTQALSLSALNFTLDIIMALCGGVIFWLGGNPAAAKKEDGEADVK